MLLVSDDPDEARSLATTLTTFSIDRVRDASEALGLIGKASYDVILVDLERADGRGVEAVHQLACSVPEAPVVTLTSEDDDRLAIECLRSGAQDSVTRGCRDERTLARAIRYAIERKRTERLVCFMAYHDSLTGLPNRTLLEDRLRHALARAERSERSLAVLFVDLDGFKTVNDRYGHAEGDRLLVRIADCLMELVRRGDTVARVGGDEFVVLLPEITAARDAALAARRIASELAALGAPASVGTAVFPEDARDSAGLLASADSAMYGVKRRRRHRASHRPLGSEQRLS